MTTSLRTTGAARAPPTSKEARMAKLVERILNEVLGFVKECTGFVSLAEGVCKE